MKKPLAIFWLIIGGAAAVTLVAFMTIVLFVMLAMIVSVGSEWLLYTLLAVFVFSVSYLARHPRKLYKKKYKVNDAVFIACTCAPSVIAAAVVYFTYTPAPSKETGVDVLQIGLLLWLISAAAFTLSVIIRACAEVIKNKIEQKQNSAARNSEDSEQ